MPELPEVETIRSGLEPLVSGRRFVKVSLPWPGAVKHPSPEEFSHRLMGRRIEGVGRRGKYLFFPLSDGCSLIVHLKMTGRLLAAPSTASSPYLRACFFLSDGQTLCFWDQRKLGALWLMEDRETLLGKLGPEPLEPSFTATALGEKLAGHRGPLKPLLCDQTFLAGLGNIYSDEALYHSRLHPLRPSGSLSKAEVRRLHAAIIEVLREALARRGTSVRNYVDALGEKGTYQEVLQVYRRRGQPCPRCGTPIQRLPVRGRGAHFCPRCQRA